MKPNVALWDRFLRFLLGIAMLSWAFAGGPIWAYLGVFVLATGAWGVCPVYSVLKLRSR